MSFEDDFVLPPRATGRPSNRRDATATRSSSASSSAERHGSGRSGGDRSRKPPSDGNAFLQTRVLSIAEYADELRRGGSERLSEDDRLRLFGTKIVPIPVPLEPKESEATHEKRFRGWLAKRRVDLDNESVASERKLRTDFAKFKARIYSNTHEAPRRGKRGRAQYERAEEEEDEEEYEEDEMDGDDRDLDEDRNYRAVYAEEDDEDRYEEEEEEDEDFRPLKRRQTQKEEEDDDAEEDYQDFRPPNQRGGQPSAELLLRKRVLSVDQYRSELKSDQVRKLTSAERLKLYGTTVVPVPVPLFPGETVDEYEEAFLRYILRQGISSAKFTNNPNCERGQRIRFARLRVTESVPQEEPEKTSILARVGEPSSAPAVVIKAEPMSEPSESSAKPSHTMTNSHVHDAKQTYPVSSLIRPPEGSTTTAKLRAFLACGCHKCLVRCVDRLVDRVEAEEQEPVVKTEPAKSVMDITRDGESSNQNAVKGVDVAKMVQLTSLMKSRRQRQSTSTSSKALDSSTREDPIELQLLDQYNEINARVGENQLALEHIAAQVQATPIDHVDATTSLQRQMQDLEGAIEDEMDNRNAALAMLAVYLWRLDKPDLTQRIQSPGTGNVPHVQRVCHQKCAKIATDLSHKRAQAAALKQELDAVLMGDSDAEVDRLATLQRVGEQLTLVEQAIAALQIARKREVATLIHFDAHVRELVETLMLET